MEEKVDIGGYTYFFLLFSICYVNTEDLRIKRNFREMLCLSSLEFQLNMQSNVSLNCLMKLEYSLI